MKLQRIYVVTLLKIANYLENLNVYIFYDYDEGFSHE